MCYLLLSLSSATRLSSLIISNLGSLKTSKQPQESEQNSLIEFCDTLHSFPPIDVASTSFFLFLFILPQVRSVLATNSPRMATSQNRAHSVLIFVLSCISSVSSATEPDVYCLKSVKDSLEDPYNHFSSWDFANQTEGFICRFAGVDCWKPEESRVLNLALSNMGLKGQFPPGIENCTSLTGLDLPRNELQGPIPSDISKRLPYITNLDLSFNNFSGEIPSSIANLSFLNVLKLDHNQLIGNIPPQVGLLQRLRNFSVADNLLSGPVPEFVKAKSTCGVFCPIGGFYSSTNVNYANNPGLCGGPLDPCKGHSNEFYSSFRTGFAAGYTVFSVSVIVGFVSCCMPGVHVKKRNKKITIQTMVMLILRKNRTEADNLSASPSVENIHGGGKEVLTI